MSRVELKGINKYYSKNHVLKELNLTIEDGDFCTLLGPSGCGKTTTLRIIAGLERPETGVMLLDGRKIIDAANAFYEEPGKRGLNLVFQSYALWPHMTVRQNIEFGLKVKKLSSHEIKNKTDKAMEMMRINEYAERFPSELSGGQQQRVAIARAIAPEPELLLLDEPLSNLDARLRIDMRTELMRLHRDAGITMIYVTHDQTEALTMSTKIALYRAGELLSLTTPMDLYLNPIDLEAANFIGNPKINICKGIAEYSDGKLDVDTPLGHMRFTDNLSDGIGKGKILIDLAVRPEHISISADASENSIPAKVYACQPAGSETLITVKIENNEFIVKQLGLNYYDPDSTVFLNINPGYVNIYNSESTRLIKRIDG